VKLTTTRLLAGLFVLSIGGVIAALLALTEPERPEDPDAALVGPSSIIRRMKRRANERLANERRAEALDFARSLHGDGGVSDAASW
jgi:hypothetical protein